MSYRDLNKEGFAMTNFAQFKSAVQKFGFSLNNFYDVFFEINPSSPLYRELVSRSIVVDRNTADALSSLTLMMRLYTDEATLPGIQMSTGEYRINNTPQLKYVYGSVFSEASFSFIMDADSIIKNVFDVWTAWMYSYGIDSSIISTGSMNKRFRTRYRDDYAVDIIVIKYERSESSTKNRGKSSDRAFSVKNIIPSINNSSPSKFYDAIPVYGVRMFKAFPSNIGSIALNSGTSELAKLSVSFEYETMVSTPISGANVITGNVIDPVNGGSPVDNALQNLFSGSADVPIFSTNLSQQLFGVFNN